VKNPFSSDDVFAKHLFAKAAKMLGLDDRPCASREY
jgi:hypothetical protein